MTIVTSRAGEEMLLFLPGTEPTTLPEYPDLSLMFSCIVAKHKGGVLLIYNAWREEWELPSGMIEFGETPYAAGLRELKEESGQAPASLSYAGVCLLRLPNGKLELGAIYTCELETITPYEANDETSGMMLLWGTAANVNEIAYKLVELAG